MIVMSISAATLLKGLRHRLSKKKKASRFASITWLQEKTLKHQDDVSIKQLNIGSLRIVYKRPYEVLHTYKELFVDEIYAFCASRPQPFIIDCGANIGLSVLYFKQLYPNADVLAFEPDGDNLALLEQNISVNKLTGVECRQSAVWVHNDDLLFEASGTQGSGIVSEGGSANVVRIKAERLADVIAQKKVDFLKIDIEGAELEVVRDCAPFLHNVENLFVEYHGKAAEADKLSELLSLLKDNYRVYIKLAADGLRHPFVEKSTGASFDVQLNIFCYPKDAKATGR